MPTQWGTPPLPHLLKQLLLINSQPWALSVLGTGCPGHWMCGGTEKNQPMVLSPPLQD